MIGQYALYNMYDLLLNNTTVLPNGTIISTPIFPQRQLRISLPKTEHV